jgi:uncharacterized membrane protein YeaQ/YmgE (transglycosylase-associated protein family)
MPCTASGVRRDASPPAPWAVTARACRCARDPGPAAAAVVVRTAVEALDLHRTEQRHMNLIIWLVMGGLIGKVASMIMRTDAQMGIFLNMVVGIAGALLGGWLISPMFGVSTNLREFSAGGLLIALGGAVILLALANLIGRGRLR